METIGKYEILDKIGSGGFAIVYKGYDPFIKRPVAIKVCFSRDQATRRRFYREAEIAGRLVHRNITTVYDFGLHEEMPYLVEEYLSGEDLAQLIRRREPTYLDEKLAYLLQIGDGLGFAHSQGVIHRDIKPSNIRVLDDGRVKIMDFGTAKLAGAESNLTQAGMTMGTIAYLAPERLCGHTANPASDLFSFGVVAYEMLTFSRPFHDTNIPALIDRVLKEDTPPLLDRAPECPTELAGVVERCLAKDPEQRWASCAELNEALRRAHKPRPVGRAAPPTREQPTREEMAASTAATPVEQPAEVVAPGVDPRRSEAVASIEDLLERGRLTGARDALRFAIHLFGDLEQETVQVQAAIARAVRREMDEVAQQGHRQARRITAALVRLVNAQRLSRDMAEHFAECAEELAPGHTEARGLVQRLETRSQDANQAERGRQKAEAIASIERLLDEGHPELADEALRFAFGLFGTFEEAAPLQRRIGDALGGRAVEGQA